MKAFEKLCAAIIKDQPDEVGRILTQDSHLGEQRVREAWLDPALVHWIYVGDTPLLMAAAGYRVEIMRLLLDTGADPNTTGTHRNARPLHYAADGSLESPAWDPNRQVKASRLLLKAEAELNARDKNGATALHRAVRTRCAAAVKCLLKAGADPETRNKPGSTPFHLAVQDTGRGGSGTNQARAAQWEIIQAFLDRKVPVTLKDGKGKTVLECARSEAVRGMLKG